MGNETEKQTTRFAVAEGLLDSMQRGAGIASDAAFARLINVDTAELERMRDGGAVSVRGLVGIAQAFGLPLREVVPQPQPLATAVAA